MPFDGSLTLPSARDVLARLLAWNEAGDPDDWDTLEGIIADAATALAQPSPAPSKARAARSSGPKGEAFILALRAAREACRDRHGPEWHTYRDATVLIHVPPSVVPNRRVAGTMLHYPRDFRAPAPRFWPGGAVPAGVIVQPEPSPGGSVDPDASRKDRQIGEANDRPGYVTTRSMMPWLALGR